MLLLGFLTAAIVALILFAPSNAWITESEVDLNSGKFKVTELVFGHDVSSEIRATEFSRQVKEYLNPPDVPPNWHGCNDYNHISGSHGDGTPIGWRCNEVAMWLQIYEVEAAERKRILARCLKALAAEDLDGVQQEVDLIRKPPPIHGADTLP